MNRNLTCFQAEKIREEEEAIKRKAEEEAKKKEAMAAMSMNYSGFMAKKQVRPYTQNLSPESYGSEK